MDELTEDAEFTRSDATAERGEILLFFGCRHQDKDWIFREEMEEYAHKGTITQLYTAFSRDQEDKDAPKVYVQKHMEQNGARLADLILHRGAFIYVCGDGMHMAKDVHAALVRILAAHSDMETTDAETYLRALMQRQQYVRDIWS